MQKLMRGLLVVGSTFVLGCGAGAVGDAARPEAPTGAEALEESPGDCKGVASHAEPLIVDWRSKERLDLELAMKKGVAVVAYDCKQMRLLTDCRVEGSYDYAGVSIKEDLVQLENADEVRANLPLTGAKIGGELSRDSSIDIALVMVGKKGSTAGEIARGALAGKCEGATHVVRAAYVGAFAMARGSRGKVRAVAEVFGAGGEAKSESQKRTSNKDGDVGACKAAKPSAPPPDQCQSAIRLELAPIQDKVAKAEEAGEAEAKPEAKPDSVETCGPGMVRAEGKCTADKDKVAYRCKPMDEAECRTQCEKGNPESCSSLGFILKRKNDPSARELFDKSCELGNGSGCFNAANERLQANMKAPNPKLVVEAEQLLDKGCLAGDGWVCMNTAHWYIRDEKLNPPFGRNVERGIKYLERGCALGYAFACASLGTELVEGKNTKKDDKRGIELFKRACDGGSWDNCEKLGNYLRDGKHVPKSSEAALTAYGRACAFGGARACHSAAAMYLKGDGVKKDEPQAVALLRRGCPDKGPSGWDACRALGELHQKGEAGAKKDLQKAADYYTRGLWAGKAGEIYEKGINGKPDLDKALEHYKKGCQTMASGDGKEACFAAGRLLAKKDKAAAKDYYADLCQRLGLGVKGYCDEYKKLGGDPKSLKKGGPTPPPPPPGPPKKPEGPSAKK